jgi:hypothetical protein
MKNSLPSGIGHSKKKKMDDFYDTKSTLVLPCLLSLMKAVVPASFIKEVESDDS